MDDTDDVNSGDDDDDDDDVLYDDDNSSDDCRTGCCHLPTYLNFFISSRSIPFMRWKSFDGVGWFIILILLLPGVSDL